MRESSKTYGPTKMCHIEGQKSDSNNILDPESLLLTGCIPKGFTINAYICGQIFQNLKLTLEDNHQNFYKEKKLQGKSDDIIKDCGFSELHHLPYGPDLTPSNFFLFKDMEKVLR